MHKILFALICILSLYSCKKQIEYANYLNPARSDDNLDKFKEGFLDRSTYQVVAQGTAFRPLFALSNQSKYLPVEPERDFDQLSLDKYNKENRINLKTKILEKTEKEKRPVLLDDVITTNIETTPQTSNILTSVDIEAKIRYELRQKLTNNACLEARVRALYRWFVLSSSPLIANEFRELEVLEDLNKVPNYNDTKAEFDYSFDEEKFLLPLLYDFDNRYFPPRVQFTVNASRQLRTLQKRMQKFSFAYEVIEEKVSRAAPLRCDCVIHIKKKDLLRNHKHLIE